MFECCDIPNHLCQFPTELIIYIFKFLSAKNLIACRQVCRRWKEVIDDVTSDENMWEEHCKRDFKTLYQDAKMKSSACRLWYDIYRSLSLWCRLSDATEVRDEFCHSAVIADEIQDMRITKNGEVFIHKRASIVYYDTTTLEATDRSPVLGEFSRYVEHEHAIIILGNHLHLRIIKKSKQLTESAENDNEKKECVYRHIKNFTIFGNRVYFVHFSNTIYYCDIDVNLKVNPLLRSYQENVLTLSMYNGSLHILTAERNVYVYENEKFVRLFGIESKKDTIFDCLWRYEFLERLDWRIFNIWVTNMRISIPEGPLRYICMMKVYGDLFFVGCKNGVVLIYYKPYTDGVLDLFTHKPVKQYRFAEREDIPVLSLHPILKIDIDEIKGGHRVLVAMPKKIIIVTFMHNFEVVKSKAVVPYVPPNPVVTV